MGKLEHLRAEMRNFALMKTLYFLSLRHRLMAVVVMWCVAMAACGQAVERPWVRLLGYYRVMEQVDTVPAYFVDGMMECFVPLSVVADERADKRPRWVDRRFLGERRRKARWAGDDTLVRMMMPALELSSLAESVAGEEYSRRTNGDIYRWGDRAGRWYADGLTVDELAGQQGHELALDALRVYGIVARAVTFEDTESYVGEAPFRMNQLARWERHQVLMARYRGEDEEQRVELWSQFYVVHRDTVDDATRRKLLRTKNKDPRLEVPDAVPEPPATFLQAWGGMEAY